ncbi:unnamed protein product [Absidia cylindrospora]
MFKYNVVNEVDLIQGIRRHQPSQDGINHSNHNGNLDSSTDNVGIQDLETGEILTRTGQPSRSDNNGKITSFYRTAIPATDTVDLKKKKESNSSQETQSYSNTESLTPLQSPLQTSTFTPLSSPSSSSTPPSASNNSVKEHRQTSSSKSSPSTKQYRRTNSGSPHTATTTATIVHKGKKVIRLSIPEPSSSAHTMSDDEEVTASPFLSSATAKKSTLRSPPRILRYLLRTGYIYDVFMSYHATLDTFDIHPEDPRRIFIYREMVSQRLLEKCKRIPIQKATQRDILAVHDLNYSRLWRKRKVK